MKITREHLKQMAGDGFTGEDASYYGEEIGDAILELLEIIETAELVVDAHFFHVSHMARLAAELEKFNGKG